LQKNANIQAPHRPLRGPPSPRGEGCFPKHSGCYTEPHKWTPKTFQHVILSVPWAFGPPIEMKDRRRPCGGARTYQMPCDGAQRRISLQFNLIRKTKERFFRCARMTCKPTADAMYILTIPASFPSGEGCLAKFRLLSKQFQPSPWREGGPRSGG
jgi:hypothetical protein